VSTDLIQILIRISYPVKYIKISEFSLAVLVDLLVIDFVIFSSTIDSKITLARLRLKKISIISFKSSWLH
jgi:hypothetical protein